MAAESHALLGASSAKRWLECTPSARASERFEDHPSAYADEGTKAHLLCERKVRMALNLNPEPLPDGFEADGEMEECSEQYLSFVLELVSKAKEPIPAVEARVDFSDVVPEGYGTADFILISGDTIHIVDYKHGKGVEVSAAENPQMMLYALGAYQKYRLLYPIETVQMEIIQPRIDNYSSYSCSLKELLAFGEEVRKKADAAIKGEGEFKPGDWCRFCRARAKCKARADYNVQLAFAAGTPPELLTDEQIGEYLKKGEDVASWLSDVKEYALKACLDGKSIPGWKAVRGRSVRVFDDTDAAFRDAMKAGVEEALLYERKPLSLSKVEKLMGKKRFNEELGSHVIKPPGKPTLAHESDKREAVTDIVTPEEAFK